MSRDPQVLPGRALAVAGGPLGRHASVRATSWLATLVPLLAATAGTMALSVVQRAHCIQQGWSGSDQFWHGCFSDLPALYQLGNLDDGLGSYLTEAGARSDHPILSGAVMASRLLATFLFGVGPTDPLTFAAVAFTLLTVALVATYIPARRVLRVDPITALRVE